MPIIKSRPEQIVHVLRDLIKMNRSKLASIGILSRKYVEEFHDPNKVINQIIGCMP